MYFLNLIHIYNDPHHHQYLWNESVNILDFFIESHQLKETSEGITFSCVKSGMPSDRRF